MFSFFDYLFYNIASRFDIDEDGNPSINTTLVLTTLQFLNICSLVLICFFFNGLTAQQINKYFCGGLAFLLIVLNHAKYFYVKKYDYHKISSRWVEISEKRKLKYMSLFKIYVGGSILLFTVLLFLLPSGR